MFHFTIRDVLMFTALVAVCVTWLMDRDKIHRERAHFAKREAELTSQRNVAVAEANRASLKEQSATEFSQQVMMALQMRGMDPKDVADFRKKIFEKAKQRGPIQPTGVQQPSPDEK